MAPTPANRGLQRLVTWLRSVLEAGRVARLLAYAGRRFLGDGCLRQAAGLSYVSLLAIVPLLAIGMAILAGFPAFESLRVDIQGFVLNSVLPDAEIELTAQLDTFVENASRMTVPGLVGLAVTAILLMSNISGALNAIWRVSEPRPLALRIVVYWVILTLGPLLIGASISVSGYAFAAVQWFGVENMGQGGFGAARVVSLLLSTLGFGLLYFLVPNRAVHPAHALAGGLLAALLFEGLKSGFGLYLSHFPSYQAVYGAVSSVPIFLIWMYLSWAVTLFGAEIAAALPEWRAARARGGATAGPGARLALALSLLARLRDASRRGDKPRERILGRGLPATPAEIDLTLRRLRRAGFVARTLGGRWVLCRDLESVTLRDLAALLDLDPAPGPGWHAEAQAAAEALFRATEDPMGRSLANLLAERDAKGRVAAPERAQASVESSSAALRSSSSSS